MSTQSESGRLDYEDSDVSPLSGRSKTRANAIKFTNVNPMPMKTTVMQYPTEDYKGVKLPIK